MWCHITKYVSILTTCQNQNNDGFYEIMSLLFLVCGSMFMELVESHGNYLDMYYVSLVFYKGENVGIQYYLVLRKEGNLFHIQKAQHYLLQKCRIYV